MRRIFAIANSTMALVISTLAADRAPSFQDYGERNIFTGKPVAVNLASHPQARHFRTMLRLEAAKGADFAGHYKIAKWGCGTACIQFAIVDSRNGSVFFPPKIPTVTWSANNQDNLVGLDYRVNSRLLVLHGTPVEDARDGVFYYVWEHDALKLLRSDVKK